MSARRRLLALVVLGAAVVAALAVGGEALQPAHPGELRAWWGWFGGADPVSVTIAVLRLATMAVAAWIAIAAAAHLAIAEARWLDRLTPRVVRAAASASLSVAVLAAPAGTGGDPHHQATMRPLAVDEPPPTTSTTIAPPATTIAPPTTTTTLAPPTIMTVPPAPAPAPAAVPVPAITDVYVVERSESLWSIAADTVAERVGHAPTDAEIVPYWRALIAANADRLVVPGNADLIYAGQDLVLPA